MSDREKAQEICNLTHHDWSEEYYGYKCQNCGEFIPYGCEPWMPFDGETSRREQAKNLQLPAKRVLEGEVVTPLTITIKTRGTKQLLEKLKDAKETINRMKKNGWVRPVFPFEKLDEGAIDGWTQ